MASNGIVYWKMTQLDGARPFLCNVTSGHMEMEQAPFAPAIARCYLAILSVEQAKLDLEAVAIASSCVTS